MSASSDAIAKLGDMLLAAKSQSASTPSITSGSGVKTPGNVTPPGYAARTPTAEEYSKVSGSYKGAKQTTKEAYTPEEQQELLDRTRSRHDQNLDAWDDDRKAQIWKHYADNLAKDNPYGNLNGMSYDNTLNLSRMADRYNNHKDWTPSTAGAGTGLRGVIVQGSVGHAEQRTPIETQEMRQMRANEQIDAAARQRQAQLQGDINAHGLEIQRQTDVDSASLAQAIGINENQLNNTLQSYIQQLQYYHPGSEAQNQLKSRFIQDLAREGKSKDMQLLARIFNDPNAGPAFSAAVAGMFGAGTLNQNQVLYEQYIRDTISQYPGANAGTVRNIMNMMSSLTGMLDSQASMYAFKQGIW